MLCLFSSPLPLQVAKGKPVVTWNIELDTHRGDLGLVSFPPKDLHYRYGGGGGTCNCIYRCGERELHYRYIATAVLPAPQAPASSAHSMCQLAGPSSLALQDRAHTCRQAATVTGSSSSGQPLLLLLFLLQVPVKAAPGVFPAPA